MIHGIFKYIRFIIILLLSANIGYAQKDTLVTSSGDQIIGKVKSINMGVLNIETDYSKKDLQLKWDKINKLNTSRVYKIYSHKGRYYVGSFTVLSEDTMQIEEQKTGNIYVYPKSTLLNVEPLKTKLIDRIILGINLGYTITKVANSRQVSFMSKAGYEGNRWLLNSELNLYATKIDTIITGRGDAFVQLSVQVWKNWIALGSVNNFTSDEQRIDLRTTALLGVGNMILHNQSHFLLIVGGYSYNKETFVEFAGNSLSSNEGFARLQYDFSDGGNLDLNSRLDVFPSFDQSDRVRATFEARIKWDLIFDFNVGIGYTLNYDSNPPNEANIADFVFTVSLGWEL